MVFYPVFKKSYKLQSQSNSFPTYASDFSLSSPPKTKSRVLFKTVLNSALESYIPSYNISFLHSLISRCLLLFPQHPQGLFGPFYPMLSPGSSAGAGKRRCTTPWVSQLGLLTGWLRHMCWFASWQAAKSYPTAFSSTRLAFILIYGNKRFLRQLKLPRGWLCELVMSSVLDSTQSVHNFPVSTA